MMFCKISIWGCSNVGMDLVKSLRSFYGSSTDREWYLRKQLFSQSLGNGSTAPFTICERKTVFETT